MKLTQSQPDGTLITLDQIKQHLRIDCRDEDNYLTSLVAAAVSHAELAMGCSLLSRTITATFYANEDLILPRGPVVSVDSVKLDNSTINPTVYTTETHGTVDVLRYANTTRNPHPSPATLNVTYTAGYGDDASDVPADIVHAIKCHIGLMYENREVATPGSLMAVPFLADFYKLRKDRKPI